ERPNLPDELDPMHLMMLERLHLSEIADLSESMIGESGRAPQVVELLAKETEGNVFFLIETIRALAEIAGLMDNIGRMTLPPTVFAGGVQMVIDRRLRKVPSDFIPLLQLVAINGRLLDLALVEALDETIDIQTWLDACINSAVLSVNDGEYRFAHDKIREGILANIDADSFVVLSKRIAEAIEKVYPDEDNLALVLAQHWQNAQDADRECHYSYIVAQKVRHHNLHQARDYALRVLELLPDDRDPRLPKVELILGEIYLNISNRDKAQFYFESGLKNAEHQRQRDYQARCLEGLGHVALRHDDGEQAMKYYQMALRRADPKDHETVALIMNSISTVHKNWGDYDKARQLAEESLALARANEYQIGIARDLNTLGVLDSYQGRYSDAWDKFARVLEIRRDLRMRHGVAGILNNLGIIASRMGKHQEAIAYHEESRQIKLDLGDRFSLGNTLQNLSLTYMHIGNYELARHYSEEALEIAREMVHRSAEADIRNNLGLILSRLYQDDLQPAREHIEAAIVLAGEVEDRLCVAYALSNLGDILITQNELDVARGILDLALREAYDLQAMSPLLRTVMWIGRMIAMNGDIDRAITLWSYVNLHESADAFTKEDSEQLLQSAIGGLSAERVANAVAEAKTLEMDALVESLRRKPKHQI
ncbi:MAG: tetratricopeptide repeat protein, partial [Chloroflexota bacterium]